VRRALPNRPLKIGFLGTLSGPAGALGQDQYDAFMLGVEHLGGKLGDSPVQVLKEDDQLKPDLGVELAKKLIEKDKVNVITGVTFSNVMMAVHKPITDAGVFLIGSNAGPTPITGKGCSPMYFSTSWNNDSLHESMGAYAREQGYKRVYLMAPNYQAGKDALRRFQGAVQRCGPRRDLHADRPARLLGRDRANAGCQARRGLCVYPGGMGVNFVKQYQQAGLLGKLHCCRHPRWMAPPCPRSKTLRWASSPARPTARTLTTRKTKSLSKTSAKSTTACPRSTPPKLRRGHALERSIAKDPRQARP